MVLLVLIDVAPVQNNSTAVKKILQTHKKRHAVAEIVKIKIHLCKS